MFYNWLCHRRSSVASKDDRNDSPLYNEMDFDKSRNHKDLSSLLEYRMFCIPFPNKQLRAKSKWNSKTYFSFYVYCATSDDTFAPFRQMYFVKQFPHCRVRLSDRRLLSIEKITNCSITIEDETDFKKILKLLKVPPKHWSVPFHRKVGIHGTDTNSLALAIVLLTQVFPSMMARAIFKNPLLSSQSATHCYPVLNKMIFPPANALLRMRYNLRIPDNLIPKEQWFHLDPRPLTFETFNQTNQVVSSNANTESSESCNGSRTLLKTDLCLSDSWTQFLIMAGLGKSYDNSARSSQTRLREELKQEVKEAIKNKKIEEMIDATVAGELSKIVSELSDISLIDCKEPLLSVVDNQSLQKVSEIRLNASSGKEGSRNSSSSNSDTNITFLSYPDIPVKNPTKQIRYIVKYRM